MSEGERPPFMAFKTPSVAHHLRNPSAEEFVYSAAAFTPLFKP